MRGHTFIALFVLAQKVTSLPIKGRYCTPAQSCWPSTSQWQDFNTTINGKLVRVEPLAQPCYTDTYNESQCAAIRTKYVDSFYRADSINAVQMLNWESCGTENCWLDSTNGSFTPGQQCRLGRISPFAVALKTGSAATDVATTIAFAKRHNIKITIKNTGHDYTGRSIGKDSLSIWTHQVNSMEIVQDYPIIKLGAGVLARDVYRKVSAAGYSITLGAFGSVGVGGGFSIGGGHGPLSPKHGLAVDNIVSYTIVTADGQLRVANATSNADLFWALRGGGPGFGVVLEVWYKLHPKTQMQSQRIVVSLLDNKIQAATSTIDLLENLGMHQMEMSDMNWSGYHFFYTDKVVLNFHLPSSNATTAKFSMQPIKDFLFSNPNKYQLIQSTFRSFPDLGTFVREVFEVDGKLTLIASGQRLAGRFISRELLSNPVTRRQVAVAIQRGKEINDDSSPLGSIGQSFNIFATSPGVHIPGHDTAVIPSWRNNSWEILYAQAWTPEVPPTIRDAMAQAVHKATGPLRALAPNAGCYHNEADQLEEDWQNSFWGSNYERLLEIKHKYDPENDFNVWKGVGWQGPDDEAYQCYTSA